MAHLFGAHGVPVVQAMGPDQPASRVINTSNDEVAKMAGIDAEAPLENLLAYIRQLANAKVLEARRKGKSSKLVHDLDGEAGSLMESFDDSALTAVGVLVEELVRDMMVQWYHTGAPVAFDGRALRTEVLTQMNGAPRPKEITPEVLRKRLEVGCAFAFVFAVIWF